MELLFVCLAAHDSEFRRWIGGVDRRICQTFCASPAEPGELLLGFRSPLIGVKQTCPRPREMTRLTRSGYWEAKLGAVGLVNRDGKFVLRGGPLSVLGDNTTPSRVWNPL